METTQIAQTVLASPAPGASFRQRADLTLERAGAALATWTGVPLDRWQREKQLLLEFVHPADIEAFRQHLRQTAQSQVGLSHAFRLRHATTERVTHLTEFRHAHVDARGRVRSYEGCWLDVTPWAEAGARLGRASWTEALSAITMGVVHDFNNALTGILSLSEHFLSQTDARHPFHEGLDLIRQNTRTAAKLAHRLLRLHHEQGGPAKLCDLNSVLSEVAELLRRFIPKRIELVAQPAATPLPVEVDSSALEQTIIYLALNAAEAIAERGRVTLETSFHPQAPVLSHAVGQPPAGATACLAIADTGAGIQAELIERIFEPFFTTKQSRQGLGLGLHHARQFAEQHGGALSVESAPGLGTTVRLWLPFVNLL